MKKIVYSVHLGLRLKLRVISRELPLKIYRLARERYFDADTLKNIAVMRVKFRNKTREMAVVYMDRQDDVLLITVHPLKTFQKDNRIKSGRWRKL